MALDPDYPTDRLSFTINDSGISALLVHDGLPAERTTRLVVDLEKAWPAIERGSAFLPMVLRS